MTSIIPMRFQHLFEINAVNIDRMTETYSTSFYGRYFMDWPEYQRVVVHGPTGIIMGYMLAKVEGDDEDWHGHVSAVSVAPPFRRTGLAGALMQGMEEVSATMHNAYFVDLFVRRSNRAAQTLYERLGYVTYQTVGGYYSGGKGQASEDARDLRKALPRNKERSSNAVYATGLTIKPHEVKWH